MNCNLTDRDRDNGTRCRSFDCKPCLNYKLSANDATIINIHIDNMRLKEENKQLRVNLAVCKRDYWFMTNLLERYSTDKDQAISDCIERMKFRNGLFGLLKDENIQ